MPGELGGDDRAGELLAVQPAGLCAEQVERADVFAGHDHRHREDAADVVGQHGGAIGGPPGVVGSARSSTRTGALRGDRVQARPLAEGELQLVILAGGRAAGAQRSGVGAVEDQRDGRRVDAEQRHARLAQPVGGVYPAPAFDGGEQLLVDRHI